MSTRSTWDRDLSGHVDRFGNIAVSVTIGSGPGTADDPRETAASAPPATVAKFLRELADDVERTEAAQPETGLDRVAAAVRRARGGPPPAQVRGFA